MRGVGPGNTAVEAIARGGGRAGHLLEPRARAAHSLLGIRASECNAAQAQASQRQSPTARIGTGGALERQPQLRKRCWREAPQLGQLRGVGRSSSHLHFGQRWKGRILGDTGTFQSMGRRDVLRGAQAELRRGVPEG